MNQTVLDALLASLDRREAVAILSITDADGTYASAVGNHCVLWLDAAR